MRCIVNHPFKDTQTKKSEFNAEDSRNFQGPVGRGQLQGPLPLEPNSRQQGRQHPDRLMLPVFHKLPVGLILQVFQHRSFFIDSKKKEAPNKVLKVLIVD